MFKNVLNIIVVTLLLISTTGFTISKHYCGTHLVSVKINNEAKSCCGLNDNCCHNESKLLQVDNDYSFNIQNIEIESFVTVIAIIQNKLFKNIIIENFDSTIIKPPGYLSTKIVKLICCFLI